MASVHQLDICDSLIWSRLFNQLCARVAPLGERRTVRQAIRVQIPARAISENCCRFILFVLFCRVVFKRSSLNRFPAKIDEMVETPKFYEKIFLKPLGVLDGTITTFEKLLFLNCDDRESSRLSHLAIWNYNHWTIGVAQMLGFNPLCNAGEKTTYRQIENWMGWVRVVLEPNLNWRGLQFRYTLKKYVPHNNFSSQIGFLLKVFSDAFNDNQDHWKKN